LSASCLLNDNDHTLTFLSLLAFYAHLHLMDWRLTYTQSL
jgi:hypothetical protein